VRYFDGSVYTSIFNGTAWVNPKEVEGFDPLDIKPGFMGDWLQKGRKVMPDGSSLHDNFTHKGGKGKEYFCAVS
jgi:hypothetical protein